MADIDYHTQIGTAFLAVHNKHITFSALTKNFPLREVENYLREAVDISSLSNEEDEYGYRFNVYPYGLEFYQNYYVQFKRLYLEDYPEVFL